MHHDYPTALHSTNRHCVPFVAPLYDAFACPALCDCQHHRIHKALELVTKAILISFFTFWVVACVCMCVCVALLRRRLLQRFAIFRET